MKTIYKYKLSMQDSTRLQLPSGAEILTVQTQNEEPCLWALVDIENEYETRVFRIAGTGHNIETNDVNGLKYISTFQLMKGALIFHVFEVI